MLCFCVFTHGNGSIGQLPFRSIVVVDIPQVAAASRITFALTH